jgi:ABC-type multidrug transport system fused ATPase/permease subunit
MYVVYYDFIFSLGHALMIACVQMGLYAVLGFLQAFFTFTMGVAGVMIGYKASKNLHRGAIARVMRAPMSFCEKHPFHNGIVV